MYSEAGLSFSKKMMESGSDTMTKMYEQNADLHVQLRQLGSNGPGKNDRNLEHVGTHGTQKDYSKGLWEATKSAYQENVKLMKESYETNSSLMKEAYSSMKDYAPAFPQQEVKPKKTKEKAAA